jgi:hypothetical protein
MRDLRDKEMRLKLVYSYSFIPFFYTYMAATWRGTTAYGHDSSTGRNAWRLAMPAVAGVAVLRRVK